MLDEYLPTLLAVRYPLPTPRGITLVICKGEPKFRRVLACVYVQKTAAFGAGGGDAWFPLLGGLYGRWHAPAPAPQLPSAFEEEPVPFSEHLSEDGVVRALLRMMDTRSTPLPPLPLPLPFPPSPVPPPLPPSRPLAC